MLRPHSSTNAHPASRPPPFGAAGWLVTILSEMEDKRSVPPHLGEVFDRPQRARIEPARLDEAARRGIHLPAPILDRLHRVLGLRIRKV